MTKKDLWLIKIRNIILIIFVAILIVLASEIICISFGRNVPRVDFRITYLLATLEPIFSAIILVPSFLIMWDRFVLSKTTLRDRNEELQKALKEKQELGEMLPICPVCKRTRTDSGYWERIETFVESRSKARFTHCMCAECAKMINKAGGSKWILQHPLSPGFYSFIALLYTFLSFSVSTRWSL